MWIFNTDTNMWVKQADTLNKDDYNNLKQDISKTQLYSKALSGATYLYTANVDNIYESLSYKDTTSWFVDPASSVYNSATTIPSDGASINRSTINQYDKYLHECGFTLKNMFTPTKGIEDINYVSVNVATTTSISVNSTTISTIDGIKLLEGNLVLVKDQITNVDLPFSLDPNTYFTGNYYEVTNNISDITYYFYNSENGIYKFTNNTLVKTSFTYSESSNLSVYVEIGTINSDSQFKLSRNLNGYFPVDGEPFEFKSSHNYLVRNQVDYHNLYENNYYDILKHGTQSLNIQGFTYTVPSRVLYVGDFGVILNNQDYILSEYVFNTYKSNLKCITQTSAFYWMCGEDGTLLKMSKLDFSIIKIDLGEEFNTLNSISFLNDLRGLIVGDYNTIYYTADGGFNWNKVVFSGIDNYSYNKVLYYSFNTAYICGDNGVFIEIDYSDITPNKWSLVIKHPIKNLTLTDEYELIDDINDMHFTHFNNWGLTYSIYVNEAEGFGITYSMDCLFLVTNNSNIIVYEINNFVTEHDFLYLQFSQSLGDLRSITRQLGTNNMVVAGDSVIKFDINTFRYTSTTTNVVNGSIYSTLDTNNYNKIFDYNGTYLYNVGNINLASSYNYSSSIYATISTVNIIPKMLFMEYDMADKLNFFDSNYNYRLPISTSFSATSVYDFTFTASQYTWIDYLKDSYKTYGVNSDTSTGNFVVLNTKFTNKVSTITFSNTDISVNVNDMVGLYPIIVSPTASRYKMFSPIIPSTPYKVRLNRYMSIFNLPSTFCSPGDILEISSPSITANVMVNYGLTTSSSVGGVILATSLNNGGSNYAINDTFSINGGITNAIGQVNTVTSGGGVVTSMVMSVNGNNYSIGQTFSIVDSYITPAIGQVTAVFSYYSMGVFSTVFTSAGTGYAVNDTFTFVGGVTGSLGHNLVGKVLTIGVGGSVATISFIDGGAYTTAPATSFVNTITTSGSGSGLIMSFVSYATRPNTVLSVILLSPGSGYTSGIKLTASGGPGSGLFVTIIATPVSIGTVTSYSLLSAGSGYTTGLASTTGITTSGTGLILNVLSTTLASSDSYFYAFTDLNQAILNSIKSNSTLQITNLNSFNNASELISNFENHPLSEGYKLSYDGINYNIDARFNNYTAYKSLENDIIVNHGGSVGVGTTIYFGNANSVRKIDSSGIITTIAGTATNGFFGDGGPAINALFYVVGDVKVDHLGNIYIADGGNNRVRKISTSGIITTIAGNGTPGNGGDGGLATIATIQGPSELAIDSFNNVYTTSAFALRKIDAITGIITTVAGNGVSGGGIPIIGNALTQALSFYAGLVVDSSGHIWASTGAYIIKIKIVPTPIITRIILAPVGVGALAIDSSDNIYFTLPATAQIGKVVALSYTIIAGSTPGYFDGPGLSAKFVDPLNITSDSLGNLYIGDLSNNRMRRYDNLTTNVTTIAGNGTSGYGGDGGLATLAPMTIYGLDVTGGGSVPSTTIYEMLYETTYNLFGYTPKYNLLNYLSNINSSFIASKKFYSMPEYSGLPCNGGGSFTDDNIYYDSNENTTFLRNKLVFGNNLKYEYDTLWVNTFVNLTLYTSYGILNKNQVLITDKYYDTEIGGWALIFNDSLIHINGFNYFDVNLNNIDIISRNTLEQVSEDLEVFNNLNQPLTTKIYNNSGYYFSFYDNPIKTKINTDSYTKILLSDRDIKKYLTSVIYTDSNNKLAMNVINVNKTEEIQINNTYNSSGQLALNTANLHDIDGTLIAFANFTGGTGSSQQLNPSYIGIHTVSKIDEYDLLVNTPYLNLTSVDDIGTLKINIFDPFFNYQPISLFDIGDDGMYKIPLLLNETNLYSNGSTNSLVNFQQNKHTFRLVDGLDINLLASNYHWILEAEISNAIIGLDSNGIVWYSGTWHTGRWFGGTWYSGTWISGDWYAGNWYSYQVVDKINVIEVGKKNISNLNSIWYDGRWFDGTWDAGTWLNGRRYAGNWNQGNWYNGIWNDGTWNDGVFSGGIWVQGTWNKGIFNSFNKPAYWIDGTFYSGDFQNGMWYNGEFGLSYSSTSTFGTLASNSRNAIWQGGVWGSGNFYSHQDATDSGVSIVHKYSIWKTGTWNQGNFYGGIVYSTDFNNGNWHGGITQDIEIIGINLPDSEITLNGIFRFNISDYVNIINNGSTGSYTNLGNDSNIGRYRVALVRFDLINNWTTLTLDYIFNPSLFPTYSTVIFNTNTGLKIVSRFKNVPWNSGIWYNGIFDGGSFNGGIWYNGVFLSGTWGS